jgi:outer membrane protein TolC
MKLIQFVILVSLSVSLKSQDISSFSLIEAQEFAVKNSPLLKNATLDVATYKQKVKEITAIGLPQINVEASFNHFLNIPTSIIPASAFNPFASPNEVVAVQFGTKYQTSAGATLSQLLFDGSYIVALKATNTLLKLQMLLEQNTEIDVRAEVTRAYYTAAISEENIKTITFTLQNIEKLKNEIQAINKEGLNEKQDVEQLELTVESMRNNLSRAENARKMSYNLLKLNLGIDVAKEITITQNIDQLNASFNSADYAAKTFEPGKLASYQILETQLTIGELNLRNEKMKYYPSFAAFLTHSYNLPSNNLEFFNRRWFPTSIWGLKLNVPVFSSGMRKAKVQQAKLGLEKTMNTMSSTENMLKLQAQNAQYNFNFSIENNATMKKSLELADRIQQKTLTKYKEGVTSSLELNQAQTQYINAQSNYINSLYSVLSSKVEMDKAYGLIQTTSTTTPENKK